MKNPVMNYNTFMSAFKSADKNYSKKANIDNKDAGEKKIDQDLSSEASNGKATAPISKYTKEHLASINKKNIVNEK